MSKVSQLILFLATGNIAVNQNCQAKSSPHGLNSNDGWVSGVRLWDFQGEGHTFDNMGYNFLSSYFESAIGLTKTEL